jgi:hypothetical protein
MQEMVHLLAYDGCRPANRALQHSRLDSKRQKGAIAVMFAGSLLLIIGFCGLALDLSRIYNRKVEMQGVAASVAVAAAKKLNGTSSGISDALAAAHTILEDQYYGPKYAYAQPMMWSDVAIKFSKYANGSTGWLSAAEAFASPGDLMYAKVDTNALDQAYGSVEMLFMPVLPSALTTVNVSHAAVAGRSRIGVAPLAICAMEPTPAAPRLNPSGNVELVEYGFRRGVSYDLMNLNPINNATKENFLVDPIAPPGSGSSPSNFALSTIGPYVCTGTMALPKVNGVSVSVQSGFPIGVLFNHLNSRFDLYNGGACDPNAAPPDTNIKQFTAATIGWMNPKPILQTAKLDTTAGRRQTIADLPPPNNQTPTQYGPLWAYARAVPWSSFSGQTEPASGYTPFAASTAIWTSLYSTGPGLSGYPAGATATPYFAGGSFASLPSLAHRPGIKNRRVLNVPLLACPVSGSSATVLGIGKFFMTIPADNAILSAEFGGATTDSQLGGPVELYQ